MASLDILKNKKYDILDPIVEDLHNKCIKMDREEKHILVERFQREYLHSGPKTNRHKNNYAIEANLDFKEQLPNLKSITLFVDMFIKKMKEVDPLFSQIFNRIGYTGSYFDGVRVGEATEFDLNLILKPKLKFKPAKGGCPAGFISVFVDGKYDNLPKHYKSWTKPLGDKCVIDPNRVSNWLQGVVQRTVTQIRKEGPLFEDCEIDLVRKSGPAWTLIIVSYKYPKKTIDVDLVPVLEFPSSQFPVTCSEYGSFNETWFVVPKPPRGPYSTDWRLSFPKQETEITRGLEFLKYTLRLMKRVRDQFQFKAIASYYIKTLFLWEIQLHDRNIWVRSRRGRLFIYMLIRLKEALEAERIPFFWDERCNLVEYVGPNALMNFCGRLRRFLTDIDRLIDEGDYEKLQNFIKEKLSTPKEKKEELEASHGCCTIL